jgi:hypothetical protein
MEGQIWFQSLPHFSVLELCPCLLWLEAMTSVSYEHIHPFFIMDDYAICHIRYLYLGNVKCEYVVEELFWFYFLTPAASWEWTNTGLSCHYCPPTHHDWLKNIVMVSVRRWHFVNATFLKPYDRICSYMVGLLVMTNRCSYYSTILIQQNL